MTQTITRGVTTDQFEAYIARPENRARRFELVHGEITEKTMPALNHGFIAGWFVTWFNLYFMEHPGMGIATVKVRHRPTGDETNDRLPDVAVTLRPVTFKDSGVEDYIPDICIEIRSPDETLKSIREKAEFYLANGARYALIVRPDRRTIEVWTLDDEILTLREHDMLTFPDLLPGFSVTAARFFPPPTPDPAP